MTNLAGPLPLPNLSELHPFCRGLLERWDTARGEAFAPSWRALDIVRIKPSAALAHCTMAEITPDGTTFIYRFYGTWHVALHNQDFTDQPIDAITPATHADRLKAEYFATMRARRPLAFHFEIPVRTGTRSWREALRVPLSNNGTDVTGIAAIVIVMEGEKEALSYFRGHQRGGG